jgi:hypothetical protein
LGLYSFLGSKIEKVVTTNGTVCMYYDASDGKLYLGGSFTTASAIGAAKSFTRLAILEGYRLTGMGSGANSHVRVIGKHNGFIHIGGAFTTANGVTVNRLAVWNGTTFSMKGQGSTGDVWGLASNSGKLFAVGQGNFSFGSTVTAYTGVYDFAGTSKVITLQKLY